MRDIKFRFWLKNDESMCSWECAISALSDTSYFFTSDEVEPMQFTGLKDKNGVDIYEGDITETVSEVLRPFDRSVKTRTGKFVTKHRVIEYRDDESAFCFVGCPITGISQKKATKWLEVIGNIYENPELLEENNV